jgi:hypothetical protein
MCCGQKRSALRSNSMPAMRTVSQNATINTQARGIQPQSGTQSSLGIRYLGSSPLRVRGPVTDGSMSSPVHTQFSRSIPECRVSTHTLLWPDKMIADGGPPTGTRNWPASPVSRTGDIPRRVPRTLPGTSLLAGRAWCRQNNLPIFAT